MLRTRLLALGLVALLALGAAWVRWQLVPQLHTGAGVVASQLCSLVFVSRLDEDRARTLFLDPMIGDALSIMDVAVHRDRATVEVGAWGLVDRKASYRPGAGCSLGPAPDRAWPAPEPGVPDDTIVLDERHRSAHFDRARLDAAVDTEFREGAEPGVDVTLAVVVLHAGRLVAERYAAGIDRDTRLPGWSMAKSLTSTLVGVAVQRGLVDVGRPGAIGLWRGTDDPRAEISLDHLLRMTSGLHLEEQAERGRGLDPSSRMLYHAPDAAHFAATRELGRVPGEHFEYMSGNFVLAMRAVQQALGGDADRARRFAEANLFEPMGMRGVVLQADPSGTLLGGTHVFARALDWARLGQLYVDGGVADGRRLLPPEWHAYVTTPTPASMPERRRNVFWEPGRSAYGAGFWLLGHGARGIPPDTFDANGFQGQYLHVVPSRRLVVVRLGATHYRGRDYERLLLDVLAALRPSEANASSSSVRASSGSSDRAGATSSS